MVSRQFGGRQLWCVSTRPTEVNGLGYSVAQTGYVVGELIARFSVVSDPVRVFERWRELAARQGVPGHQVQDIRLVALMVESGIRSILTFNDSDFKRFSEVEAVHPTSVLL